MAISENDKPHEAGKLIQDAYFFLLQVPHGSKLRIDIDPLLAALRDHIAAELGAPSEFVQTTFETNADKYKIDGLLKYASEKITDMYIDLHKRK